MIKIDKGVPLPVTYTVNLKYPWLEMEIGDSFFVNATQSRIGSHAWQMGNRHNRKFTTRKVDGGVRVWRVE